MTHFGLLSRAATGHLNTFLPLGIELKRRGHQVSLIGVLHAEKKAIEAGFNFCPMGQAEISDEAYIQFHQKLGELSGTEALKFALDWMKCKETVLLRDVPIVVKAANIDALLIDQTWMGASSVAEFLNLPFITICSAILCNREPDIPPFLTPWNYSPGILSRLRNQIGYALFDQTIGSVQKIVSVWRKEHQLPPRTSHNANYSPLAQLSQQPPEFEFPRRQLPPWFHFTGPYHYSMPRQAISFPYDKLTGQPLIYASMGTIHNRVITIFQQMAEACAELDVQLVISLGGSAKPDQLPALPGSPIVCEYAPQLELLKRASLTITHAGLNTTLESLSNGVPMVAIPIAGDQLGCAARIAWTETGKVIQLNAVNPEVLRSTIQEVLSTERYRQNALKLQAAIARSGGVTLAADIIETAITTRQSVLRQSLHEPRG